VGIWCCFNWPFGRDYGCLRGFYLEYEGLPFLMHRVLQLFYIMNKAIQLQHNKVKAFTFA